MSRQQIRSSGDGAIDPSLVQKKRARHRLVGAICLCLLAAVIVPLVLESEPRPRDRELPIELASPDRHGDDHPAAAAGTSAPAASPASPASAADSGAAQSAVKTVVPPTGGATAGSARHEPKPLGAGETFRGDATKADAAKPNAAKTDAAKTDAARADGVKADAAKADAAKSDAVKAEAGKADATKADAAKAGTAKADAAKAKADAAKAEAGRADGAKAEAARAEVTKAEAAKVEAAKVEAAKAEAMRQQAARQEGTRQEAARLEAARQEARPTARADASRTVPGQDKPAGPGDEPDVLARLIDRAPGGSTATEAGGSAAAARKYLVQIGAYSNVQSARTMSDRVVQAGLRPYQETVKTAQGDWIRVRVGPFTSRQEAERAQQDLKRAGVTAAIIVL